MTISPQEAAQAYIDYQRHYMGARIGNPASLIALILEQRKQAVQEYINSSSPSDANH